MIPSEHSQTSRYTKNLLQTAVKIKMKFLLHPDYIEYDDAAEEFHPFVKFFATFDPKVSIKKRANI